MSKMGKMELACRFCLKLPDSEAVPVDEVTRRMFDILQIQENFNVFQNPIMCKECSDTIERLYAFKSLCVDTQDLICLSNVQENRTDIDLRGIYKAKTGLTLDQEADVCRLCMKPSGEDGLISIEALNIDTAVVEMWTKYMSEVDLNITRNPTVCFDCKDNIQRYFKFILGVEVALGSSNRLAIKKEDVTEASPKNPYEIKNYPLVKEEERDLTQNSQAYFEGQTQNYTVKQEPSGTEYEQIPKLENELDIKEEKGDYDEYCIENLDGTLSSGCLTLVTQSKDSTGASEMGDRSCVCGNCANEVGNCKEKPHKCVVCNFQTNRKSDLKKHMIKHKDPSEVISYQCPHCSFATHWRGNLKHHVQTHSSETYNCAQCNFTTKRKTYLKKHVAAHDNPIDTKSHECTICDYKTKFKRSLNRHVTLRHTDKTDLQTYICFECEYQTFWKDDLRKHVLIHNKIPKYTCSSCSYFSDNITALRRHSLVHKSLTEIETHQCTLCSFKTKLKDGLSTHMKTHTKWSELQLFKCEQCSYETYKKSALTRHALVHKSSTETQMFYCAICSFGTKRKSNLKVHVLKHQLSHKNVPEAKPYKCPLCDYQTETNEDLLSHVKSHKKKSRKEVFKCFQCGFETNLKYYLRVHIRVKHSEADVPIYSCTLCSYKSKYKFNLNNHAKAHETKAMVYECEVCQFKTICKRVSVKHKQTH